MLLGDARRLQALWRCSRAGHTPGPLAPDCTAAVERVERLIGCQGEFTGCPNGRAWTDDAARVSRCYSWWLRGQLALIEPHPHGALIDAIDLLHGGIEAAKADAMRRMREEHEREMKKR